MVRSPYPHARIASIDSAAALRMPGVLAVYTGADCATDGLKPIPHSPVPSTRYDMKLTAPGGGKVFEGPHVLLRACAWGLPLKGMCTMSIPAWVVNISVTR